MGEQAAEQALGVAPLKGGLEKESEKLYHRGLDRLRRATLCWRGPPAQSVQVAGWAVGGWDPVPLEYSPSEGIWSIDVWVRFFPPPLHNTCLFMAGQDVLRVCLKVLALPGLRPTN